VCHERANQRELVAAGTATGARQNATAIPRQPRTQYVARVGTAREYQPVTEKARRGRDKRGRKAAACRGRRQESHSSLVLVRLKHQTPNSQLQRSIKLQASTRSRGCGID